MGVSTISLGLGLGGGKSATSSGTSGGGVTPFSNVNSLSFDGTDDTLSIGSVLTPSATSGSISGWAKVPSSNTGQMPILAWSNITNSSFTARVFLTIRNGKARFYHQDSTNIDIVEGNTSGLNNNNWHHVAVVSNGSSYVLYVNGSAETLSVPLGTNSGDWVADMVGTLELTEMGASRRASGLSSDFGQGLLDEVALWDSALTASNITAIYNSGVPNDISSLNPVGWWRMGDNNGASGTTITDQGSGGNNATLLNGPTFTTDVPS